MKHTFFTGTNKPRCTVVHRIGYRCTSGILQIKNISFKRTKSIHTILMLFLSISILFSCDRAKETETSDQTPKPTTGQTTDQTTSQTSDQTNLTQEEADDYSDDDFGKVRKKFMSILKQGTAYQCDIPIIIENNGDCGYIEVPKDYSDTSKGHFNMFWYKLTPENPVSDNVVVPLVDGPGSSVQFDDITLYLYTTEWSNIKNSFAILGFDYRGEGLSQPFHKKVQKECNEKFLFKEKMQDYYPVQVNACIDQISHAIDDYKHISSRNIVRDLETLLDAHQVEEAVLFGTYYGSRLALTALRDIPSRVSAVVLDAAVPVEVNMITQSQEGIINNLQHIAQLSDSKPVAKKVAKKVVSTYDSIVELLKQSDYEYSMYTVFNIAQMAYHYDISSVMDQYYDVMSKGEVWNVSAINDEIISEDPPNLSYNAAHYYALKQLYPNKGVDMMLYRSSRELQYILMMSEEYPFVEQQQSKEKNTILDPFMYSLANRKIDWLLSTEELDLWRALYDELAEYNVISDIEMEPVKTDKPILVYGGMRDMYIPAQWAKQIMNNASHSRLFLFYQYSHPVSALSFCAIEMAIPFIKNPSVQALEDIASEDCYDEEYKLSQGN